MGYPEIKHFEMTFQSEEDASAYAAHSTHWAAFGAAQSGEQSGEHSEAFHASWLSVLCSQVGGVAGGLLLIAGEQANTFVPAAAWPSMRHDLGYLGPHAQGCLSGRKGTLARYKGNEGRANAGGAFLACPVVVAGELKAAVALDVSDRPDAQLQHALRLVHWGSAWLSDRFRLQALRHSEQRLQAMGLVNAVVAQGFDNGGFEASAMAVVNDLARRMACDRVSLGMARDGFIALQAVSNSASFDPRAVLMQRVAEAMEEVLDSAQPLRFPADGDEGLLAGAQAVLAQEASAQAVLSVPLLEEGAPIGVLTLERHRGEVFSASDVGAAKVLGMMLGPLLALKRERERGVLDKAWQGSRQGLRALFGPGHGGLKLVTVLGVCLLLALGLVNGEYRVAARTVVEGEVQQAAAAPFEGFIAEARVKAGDVVRKGQLMARLDDRDLQIELIKWRAEREQYLRKYQQALAKLDRASIKVLDAQAEQAQSQVRLVEDKLQRTRLVAPFDGVVVTGDLRQLVGTPVEQGKVLFETAPMDAFRIVLQVDERDIGALSRGQSGDLVLSGIPGERFRFHVKQITPVAVAEDGRNYFRVEAQMAGHTDRLRPGMEGVGKVEAGQRRLIWIWTHSLLDWLRLMWWSWAP